MKTVEIKYKPQPKQQLLHKCAANEILYGGAAGGGKSAALRHEALDWALRIPGLQVYVFRRTYPELEDNHILPALREFPQEIGKFLKQDKRWELINGSMIHFCHCQFETDVTQYQGAEIHLLIMDELTTFTEFQYDFLRARVRCTIEVPEKHRHKVPGIVCASNPGGIGHDWVKRRWVNFAEPMQLRRSPDNEGGMLRCFIPAKLEDNEVLTRLDPSYRKRVMALPEPLRSAWLNGDWDIFLGQAFSFSYASHVVNPMPVPEFAPLYMSFDWGFAKPFSVGWWWLDRDNRLYRFDEWYGWNGIPDMGLRMTDSEIATGIREKEEKMGLKGAEILRLADPTCFNAKPNYKGGGQGPSTYEEFLRQGITILPGDANRKLKIRQFHERLRQPADGTRPMMQIYRHCESFIRTVPLLQSDTKNMEDIDTRGEDHIYDEACHVCMTRPIGVFDETSRKRFDEEERQKELAKLDPTSRRAAEAIREAFEQAKEEEADDLANFDDMFFLK